VRVAYQGEPGAFSHEACIRFLPTYEAVRKDSFADVFESVAAGETDLGVLPEENVAAGVVPEVRALLDRGELEVIARHVLPIRMHLLGIPGATLAELETVVSHPIALAQCAGKLARMGLRTEPAQNTASAAKALAAADDPTRAVLASEAAAETYGLSILLRDLQDRADNATRFAVLARSAPATEAE
jgi:prephenate dehydratase